MATTAICPFEQLVFVANISILFEYYLFKHFLILVYIYTYLSILFLLEITPAKLKQKELARNNY